MDFTTKIGSSPTQVIELNDISRMKQYQMSLIDTLLYEPIRLKNGKANDKITDAILIEISAIERWLKKQLTIFVNDNKRKFIE